MFEIKWSHLAHLSDFISWPGEHNFSNCTNADKRNNIVKVVHIFLRKYNGLKIGR